MFQSINENKSNVEIFKKPYLTNYQSNSNYLLLSYLCFLHCNLELNNERQHDRFLEGFQDSYNIQILYLEKLK